MLGLFGGTIWHGVKGMYKAPRGEKVLDLAGFFLYV